ncbi:MAG: glycosyltransferase family 4 protein [Synergistaceae bacterium]
MKILLINHYAGSVYHGMEFRPYYLAREWVKMGHEVIIVAASFSHLRQKNVEMYAPIKEEIIDGIKYIWLKTPSYQGNGLGRIMNMLSFLCKLYRYLKHITKDFVPDAVIASSTYPLDSYPANWIAKKHSAKFVFELHDLWPMSPMVLGNMSKYHPFIWIMQRGEDYWCRNADVVISLHPGAYRHLTERGLLIEKFNVVTNGIEISEWIDINTPEIPLKHLDCIRSLRKQRKFILGYAGGHSLSNGLELMLEVADILRCEKEISFVFVGQGQQKEDLILRAKKLGLDNVHFLPPIPKRAIPKFYHYVDALFCCLPRSPLLKFGVVMNKTFEFMIAKKPVVCANSSTFDPVSESACGFTVPSGDAVEMAEKIKEIRKLPESDVLNMATNGYEYVLSNYSYPFLAQKFINILLKTLN